MVQHFLLYTIEEHSKIESNINVFSTATPIEYTQLSAKLNF